jgi:hypothetical protein
MHEANNRCEEKLALGFQGGATPEKYYLRVYVSYMVNLLDYYYIALTNNLAN